MDASTVVNAMKTHPKVVIDGALVDSSCYQEPDEFLAGWASGR